MRLIAVLEYFRVTFSTEAAKLIEDYAQFRSKFAKNSFELALYVYREIKEVSLNVLICLVSLGRMEQLTEFIKTKEIGLDTCLELLAFHPQTDLGDIITRLFVISSLAEHL